MLKNLIQMEHVVQGKVIHLLVEGDTQISHIKDALCSFMGHCHNVEQAAKAQPPVVPVSGTPDPVVAEAPEEAPTPPEV